MARDWSEYVHEYETDDGRTVYGVGRWNQDSGQFTRPLDAEERRLTGCHTEFGPLSYMPQAATLEDAEALARRLFGLHG